MTFTASQLRTIYQALLRTYGRQYWWPAETSFEVMIGAVLTQNTAWTNVERSIANLKALCPLDAESLLKLKSEELTQALRPSGYFNVKTKRLLSFCHFWRAQGGWQGLSDLGDASLRQQLLSVHGIGPETADDILLYGFKRSVFVIDAYTRRIFSRLGWLGGNEPYEQIRMGIEQALEPPDVSVFNEYHALIVRHAKESCQLRRPKCAGCCLRKWCNTAGIVASEG